MDQVAGTAALRATHTLAQAWDDVLAGLGTRVVAVNGPLGSGRTFAIRNLYRHFAWRQSQPGYWPVDPPNGDERQRSEIRPLEFVIPKGAVLESFWAASAGGLTGARARVPCDIDAQIHPHAERLREAMALAQGLSRARWKTALDGVFLMGQLIPIIGPIIEALDWAATAAQTAERIPRTFSSAESVIARARRVDYDRVFSASNNSTDAMQRDADALSLLSAQVPISLAVDSGQYLDDISLTFLNCLIRNPDSRVLVIVTVATDLDTSQESTHLNQLLQSAAELGILQRADLELLTAPELVSLVKAWGFDGDEEHMRKVGYLVEMSEGSPRVLRSLLDEPDVLADLRRGARPASVRATRSDQLLTDWASLPATTRIALAELTLTTAHPAVAKPKIRLGGLAEGLSSGWIRPDPAAGALVFSSDVAERLARDQARALLAPDRYHALWSQTAARLEAWKSADSSWLELPFVVAERLLATVVDDHVHGNEAAPSLVAELLRLRRLLGESASQERLDDLAALAARGRSSELVTAVAEQLFDAGRVQEAGDLIASELVRAQTKYPKGHPAIVRAMHNAAALAAAQAKAAMGSERGPLLYGHAARLYSQLLEMIFPREGAGRCSARAARAMEELAQLQSHFELRSETPETWSRVVFGYEHCEEYGPESFEAAIARNNYTHALEVSGSLREALKSYAELIPHLTRVLGGLNRHTLIAKSNRAYCTYRVLGAHAAGEQYKQVITEMNLSLGSHDIDTLTARHGWSFIRGESESPAAAVAAMTDLARDCERFLGRNAALSLNVRSDRAFWRMRDGDLATALDEYRTELASSSEAQGPISRGTLLIRFNIADILGKLGRLEEAKAEWNSLIPLLSFALGAPDATVKAAYSKLSALQWPPKH